MKIERVYPVKLMEISDFYQINQFSKRQKKSDNFVYTMALFTVM